MLPEARLGHFLVDGHYYFASGTGGEVL